MTRKIGRRALVVTTLVILPVIVSWAVAARGVSARGNVGAPLRSAPANHTITVGGHGEVSVAPDMATITLGVQTKGDDAASALSTNSSKIDAVVAAVEAQGVPAAHIQTTNLSVYFDSQGGAYVADHQISVRLDGTGKVGAVLDAGVGAGANNSWGVSFGLRDPSSAHSTALQAAVTDAHTRADGVAAALGVSITGVGSASEGSFSSPPIEFAGPRAPGVASAPTQVQPGQLTISADVSVVYTFG